MVEFPGLGQVSIRAIRANGKVPYVDFVSSKGEELLRVEPEADKFWEVYDIRDATGPHIYFGVLDPAGLPNPVVLVADRYVAASDCGVSLALVGVWNGKLQVLTPTLEEFFTRGGAYLENAHDGRPARLTVAAERYEKRDVHVDGPSKMALYRYDFDSNAGKFVLVKHELVPTDKVKLEGRNLLLAIPELGTC